MQEHYIHMKCLKYPEELEQFCFFFTTKFAYISLKLIN